MDYPTTFPPASLLVVPRDHGSTVSGVLVARDSGYLTVQVQFHGDPVAGLEVHFFSAADDGARGDAIGEVVVTDDEGIARASRVLPAGLYVCAVEDQDDLVVSTVADFDDAYPVVLPVGRSYVDLHDGVEFGIQDDGGGDDGGGDDSDNDSGSDAAGTATTDTDQTDEGSAES